MTESTTQPVPTAITQFKQAAARAIFALQAAGSLQRGELPGSLMRAGINPFSPDDQLKFARTGPVETIALDETDAHAALPSGVNAGEMTAEAVARLDAEYLAKLRKTTWNEMRRNARDGRFPMAATIQALRDLGYADANLPSVVTHVEAIVIGRDGKGTNVKFNLAGEHKEADVRDQLTAAAGQSQATAVVRAAFGEAARGLPEPVGSLYVDASSVWPEYTAE